MGLCNFFGGIKCRKTTSPKIEIRKVRVHSPRLSHIFPPLNSALQSDARPRGHQATNYKILTEKEACEGLLIYGFVLPAGFALSSDKDSLLFMKIKRLSPVMTSLA